ncbi:MAG: DUF5615 family PIN-like protein [Dehalococcoidia bacterium]
MHLIVDENVPDSVPAFLEDRGHTIDLVRERFGQMTPDELIAWAGDQLGAVVLTLDKDFRRIVTRIPAGGKTRFRSLGRISLRCRESHALLRLQEFIEEIEAEYEKAMARGDRRLIVEITETSYRIVR